MNKLIDENKIYHEEDKYWKIGVNILLVVIIGFSITQAVRYFIFL